MSLWVCLGHVIVAPSSSIDEGLDVQPQRIFLRVCAARKGYGQSATDRVFRVPLCASTKKHGQNLTEEMLRMRAYIPHITHSKKHGSETREDERLWYIKEVCTALEYMAGLGILHRDIAARNILLGAPREPEGIIRM